MSNDPELSPKEIAGIMRCTVRFVLSEIRSGRLGPSVKVNRKVIWVKKSVVYAYLSAKTRVAAA